MIYWTTYNFAGFLLYKFNYIPMNSVLKTSFICTSLIGGYMVYIYPRKMIARFHEYKYTIPYPILIFGDFITHQYPLINTYHIPNEYPICGAFLIPNMLLWYVINKIKIKNTNKIYGISLEKLTIGTLGIIGSVGYYHHYFLKK